MSINAVHVIPSIGTESSGPSYSVVSLCQSLRNYGVSVTLVDLKGPEGPYNPSFEKSFPVDKYPTRLGRSSQMRRWLNDAARAGSSDIIHNHSLWMMPNVYSCNAVKGTNVPLVVSPRGTLSEWAMKSGSKIKKVFWPLVQRPALRGVTCFHATAESEYEDIRRMGFTQPVTIIPNGIHLPDLPRSNRGAQRTLLFLGRLDPIKGLDMLLPAWKVIQNRFPEWRLRIVGPDNGGYLDEITTLATRLGVKRVDFSGPLSGGDKTQAYADADLFVLPSYSENFGMTVAESLAAGTPAVVTRGAPWGGLEKNGAGWWIDVGQEPLVACLECALSRSRTELDFMGLNGRNWMQADNSWDSLAQRMQQTYGWLLGQNEKPECVITG